MSIKLQSQAVVAVAAGTVAAPSGIHNLTINSGNLPYTDLVQAELTIRCNGRLEKGTIGGDVRTVGIQLTDAAAHSWILPGVLTSYDSGLEGNLWEIFGRVPLHLLQQRGWGIPITYTVFMFADNTTGGAGTVGWDAFTIAFEYTQYSESEWIPLQ